MTKQRFWVIGGEYSCMAFTSLKDGKMMGPYETRDEAQAAWKQVSNATRSSATARYSIASESFVPPN